MRLHDIMQGDQMYGTFDSLSAFWPGLQVLAGDLENAIKSHMTCKRNPNVLTVAHDTCCRLEYLERSFWASRDMGHELSTRNVDAVPATTRYVSADILCGHRY